jgi:hypothetical protein
MIVALSFEKAKSTQHASKTRLAEGIVLRAGKVYQVIDTAVALDHVAMELHLAPIETGTCDGLQGGHIVERLWSLVEDLDVLEPKEQMTREDVQR